MPKIPAMLVTRDTRLLVRRDASLSRISPVGRSTVRAGAFGLEGEEKMYESEAVWTLISRKGSVMVIYGAAVGRQPEGEREVKEGKVKKFEKSMGLN